jgi:hypothetical protein
MPLQRPSNRHDVAGDIERYLRDEHLYAELERLRAQTADPRQLTLERNLYAVSSYFAA